MVKGGDAAARAFSCGALVKSFSDSGDVSRMTIDSGLAVAVACRLPEDSEDVDDSGDAGDPWGVGDSGDVGNSGDAGDFRDGS